MRKKRKPKKRTGTSSLVFRAFLPVVFLAAVLPLAASPKKKPVPDTYAVISGSVFDSSGYALPGADVTLAPDSGSKEKPLEAASDARGEFIFRVAPGPSHYVVTVSAKGRQTQHKSVSVESQERVEVTFQLESESK